jgi:RNA-binding protein YlmH
MTKKSDGIFQHFTLEERDFVEKMIDACHQVEESYSYYLTAFLNPREEEILQSLAGYFHLQLHSSRQFLETEFVRVILAPDYYLLEEEDFELMALEILYPRKFHQLTHSQILGTLLHQLGIKRDYIGDILLGEEQTFVILDRRFGELAQRSLSKISRVPVSWKVAVLSQVPAKTSQDVKSQQVLLSSLRLDKVVATAFHLSRSNALKLIESGQVKLDYKEVKQAGKVLEVGQLVSVRGFGRVRLKEFLGFSKQGKLKLDIDIIKK